MDTLRLDMRQAVRALFGQRGTSLVAMITIALGIGANTAMFTLLDATLFAPPRVASPDRLLWLSTRAVNRSRVGTMSYPAFRQVQQQLASFGEIAGYHQSELSLGGAHPERVTGVLVTGSFFSMLGLQPVLGRLISAADDGAPGGTPVAVISKALWQRNFGSDPAAVGRTIRINGTTFTVVGILAPGFSGFELDQPPDVWLPMTMLPVAMPGREMLLTSVNAGWLRVIGRLRDGISPAAAAAEASATPLFEPGTVKPEEQLYLATSPVIGGIDPQARSEAAPVLLLLSGVPLLVLLVACANVTNIQLARAMARRKEFAMRRALGATRGRLVRQVLTECTLLALGAGALGVLMSLWLTRLIGLVGQVPPAILDALHPDQRVLLATTMLAVGTGVIMGLLPALSATGSSLTSAMKNESVTLRIGRSRHRLRNLVVVLQVTVSLVLLVTAGLFLRSLSKASSVNPGFSPEGAMTLSFNPAMQQYDAARQSLFERRVLQTVRALPGVQYAALTSNLPLTGRLYSTGVLTEGAVSGDEAVESASGSISPAYFDALGARLEAGRDIAESDDAGAPRVAIVNRVLADRLWPGEQPIGKHFRTTDRDAPLVEVIGVAAAGKYDSFTEDSRSYFYVPQAQERVGDDVSLVVRTTGDAAALLRPVSAAVQALDPDMPLYRVARLRDALTNAIDKQRAAAALLGVFGALTLLLAALGIYSVIAHGVSLRRREVGIRVALGASLHSVQGLFLREGLMLSAVGVAIGLAFSVALSGVLRAFLFGLGPTDAITFVGGAVLLVLTAAVASYIPARRASRVDPMTALRNE